MQPPYSQPSAPGPYGPNDQSAYGPYPPQSAGAYGTPPPGYGTPPPGYGTPPPGYGVPKKNNTGKIVAIIVGIVVGFLVLMGLIGGILFVTLNRSHNVVFEITQSPAPSPAHPTSFSLNGFGKYSDTSSNANYRVEKRAERGYFSVTMSRRDYNSKIYFTCTIKVDGKVVSTTSGTNVHYCSHYLR